jgi:hypothetical protein
MMAPMRIAAVLLLLPLVACAPKPPVVTYDAPFDAPFTAALGKPVRMEGISLEFTRVVEESRCPKHVTCVWQGAASVALTVLAGEQPKEITLATSPAEAARQRVAGFAVELLDLAPYPDATVRRASMDYLVTLRVTRVE